MTSDPASQAGVTSGRPVTMETPLSRVRGLGAAGEGAHHWWHERVSSLATMLLFIWLGVALVRLPELDHGTLTQFLSGPLGAVPMALLLLATFWHLRMGLRVVAEDYVHDEGNKLIWLIVIDFASVFGLALGLYAIFSIAFGGDGQ